MQKNRCQIVLPIVLAVIASVRMHGWADEARIRAAATMDAVRLTQADREHGNWLTHSRTCGNGGHRSTRRHYPQD